MARPLRTFLFFAASLGQVRKPLKRDCRPDDGEDKGAEGDGAEMEVCIEHRGGEQEGLNVLLLHRPVPLTKNNYHHLSHHHHHFHLGHRPRWKFALDMAESGAE